MKYLLASLLLFMGTIWATYSRQSCRKLVCEYFPMLEAVFIAASNFVELTWAEIFHSPKLLFFFFFYFKRNGCCKKWGQRILPFLSLGKKLKIKTQTKTTIRKRSSHLVVMPLYCLAIEQRPEACQNIPFAVPMKHYPNLSNLYVISISMCSAQPVLVQLIHSPNIPSTASFADMREKIKTAWHPCQG